MNWSDWRAPTEANGAMWPCWSVAKGAGVLTTLSLLLVSCGSVRSPEAFCGALDQHGERFQAGMGSAAQSLESGKAGEAIAGIGGGLAAIADLQSMWEELADVAPEEIRVDVELIRDENQKQLDSVGESVDHPRGVIDSGIIGGFKTNGAFERVDEFTRAHCVGTASEVVDVKNNDEETLASPESVKPFLGTWAGPVDQEGSHPYSVRLTFGWDNGSLVGSSAYPELSDCKGDLVNARIEAGVLQVDEVIVSGPSNCGGATLIFERDGDSLRVKFAGPAVGFALLKSVT